MSNLKHQSLDQLTKSKAECEEHIANLKSQLIGQQERYRWIERYIFEKTVQELSIEQIEQKLGHRVVIKRGNNG